MLKTGARTGLCPGASRGRLPGATADKETAMQKKPRLAPASGLRYGFAADGRPCPQEVTRGKLIRKLLVRRQRSTAGGRHSAR